MKTTHSRRLRNAHQHDEKQKEPFFSQTSKREQRPFFNAQQESGQTVQAKLTIGKSGDRYEQEADRVASDVVAKNGQSPRLQRQGLDSIRRMPLMIPQEDEKLGTAEARMEKDKLIQEKIQRMSGQKEEEKVQAKDEEEEVQAKEEEEKEVQSKEDEEEEVQTKEEEEEEVQAREEEEEVQTKEEGGRVASPSVSMKIKKSAGGGMPLSGEVRIEMERAFGADFSGVNIHTDADAVRLNKKLRSQAFTRGQDIFFNEGKYRPETSAGKQLLAHELAHVVQQCGRKSGKKQKK
jgi:hypothetical protein